MIHLAGYIEVGESVKQPERYLHNNAAKSDALIEAALRHGVDALVFSSTCAVYGLPQTDLLAETHRIAPISPYAESKARVERALAAAAGRGLRSAALRYFNAAGADADGAIGEAHHPETHLLPLAADAVLGLGPAITLLGTDYPTPDGSCIRDFVHVSDLAEAHLKALDWLQRASEGGIHEAFNLGSGTGYSVRQAIGETARIAGRAVPHTVGPRRPGDSPKLVGDIAKARRRTRLDARARPGASRSRTRCAGGARCRGSSFDEGVTQDEHVHLGPQEAVERFLGLADDRLVLVEAGVEHHRYAGEVAEGLDQRA